MGGKLAKPKELVQLLALDPATTRVVKTETYLGLGEFGEADSEELEATETNR